MQSHLRKKFQNNLPFSGCIYLYLYKLKETNVDSPEAQYAQRKKTTERAAGCLTVTISGKVFRQVMVCSAEKNDTTDSALCDQSL